MTIDDIIEAVDSFDPHHAQQFWVRLIANCADVARSNYEGARRGNHFAVELNIEINEHIRRFSRKAITGLAREGHEMPLKDLLGEFFQRMARLGDAGGAMWALKAALDATSTS
jgi:hypothetical protein